jgi:hypothetical protein
MSTPAATFLGMNSCTRPEPSHRSHIPTGPRVGLWGINANPRLHQRHHRGHGWAAVARVCSQSVPEPPPALPLMAPHRSRSLSPTCRQTMRRPSKYLTFLRFPSVLPGSSPGGPTTNVSFLFGFVLGTFVADLSLGLGWLPKHLDHRVVGQKRITTRRLHVLVAQKCLKVPLGHTRIGLSGCVLEGRPRMGVM